MNFFKLIKLENYRNFKDYTINFSNKCNVLIGANGSGKTNILESISLFERGRGFRKDKIQNLVNNSSKDKIFKINSKFFNQDNEVSIVISNDNNINKNKKKLVVNGSSSIDSINFFENCFSIICFLPEMERLFLASPAIRRNFLDKLIYGVDRSYINILNNYKKKILERFKVLKYHFSENEWLDRLETEIVTLGLIIYKKRIQHIKNLNSILSILKTNDALYKFELQVLDNLFLDTQNSDEEKTSLFLSEIKKSRNIDVIIGGCKVGPHKTNISATNNLNNMCISQYSTGQQKTIVLLIIIAQCKYLLKNLKRNPIILFDEVCSHLDAENRKLLLEIVDSLDVQTIMTGTEKNFFSFLSTKATYCNINNN